MSSKTQQLFNQYISTVRKEKKRRKRLIQIGVLACIVCIVLSFIGIGRIQSDSMEPAFQEGHFIIYNKWDRDYQVGDVVVIEYEDHMIVRRIVGVYGDKIDIDNEQGIVLINDVQEENQYAEGLTLSDPLGIKFPVVVGQRQVFVLCDQRDISTDSRKMGCINYKSIKGKVILTL